MSDKSDRRSFLGKTVLGAAAVGAASTLEERILMAALEDDKAKPAPKRKASIAPGSLPCGKVGKVTMSRLIIGGNLIGGFSHSRDMLYVSSLFKAYNTDDKVFETLDLCEQCGINTIQIDPVCQGIVDKYRRRGGKIQTLVCMHTSENVDKTREHVKRLVDGGATIIYTHGEDSDHRVMNGRSELLAKAVELVKEQGLSAGIGGHSLETVMCAEKNKLGADFYVKTFHLDRYWSATPKDHREEWCWAKPQATDHDGYHDNMWCLDWEKTAAFFETTDKPWFAFKVMAAGAIPPKVGFAHAFRSGADFVMAGMFDFQVETDVQIAIDTLKRLDTRPRPWRA
jgi:hypothetical protein